MELTKKDIFSWGESQEQAFEKLKHVITSTLVLRMLNFQTLVVVEANTSNHGVGAVLSQEGLPIAFFSKALGPTFKTTSAYERELIAIVLAIVKWKQYLMGQRLR